MGTGKKEAARKERQGKVGDGMSNVRVKGENFYRSAKKVKTLNMFKEGKAQRDKNGKITKAASYQNREAPNARVEPNRKWFTNSRVISQSALESFRTAMAERASDPYQVLLKSNKLPLSLIRDPASGKNGLKEHQAKITVEGSPFGDTFGPKAQRKRVKMGVSSLEDLAGETDKMHESYIERLEHTRLLSGQSGAEGPEVGAEDETPMLTTAREPIFSKGQSKRIWNELYKVIDSSDVVIHVLDARDPLGTRCRSVEKYMREEAPHKHLLFVLNKCDLVPTSVAVSLGFPFARFNATVQSGTPSASSSPLGGCVCYDFGRLTPCSPFRHCPSWIFVAQSWLCCTEWATFAATREVELALVVPRTTMFHEHANSV
jgi:nuclear GTP-binding protein